MNKSLVKALFYGYLIAAFAYAMYGSFAQTGLAGYFMNLQMDLMGRAYLKLSAMLAVLVLFLPAYPVSAYLRSIGVFGKDEAVLGLQAQKAPEGKRPPVALRTITLWALVPSVIATPAYFIAKFQSDQDQQRTIASLDLESDAGTPPADAKFVELKSAMQMAYRYQVKESRSYSSSARHTYAPLTSSGWNTGQPVVYFINTTIDEGWNANPRNPRGASRNLVVDRFQGKLVQDGLPTFVRTAYEKEGIKIATPHYVLERMHFHDGKIPNAADRQQYHLIWILGLGASAAIFVGGLLGWLLRKMRGKG
jgi:hypothetical protein